MRDTTGKHSSSRAAALTRSGGGVRARRLASCAVLLAAAAGAQFSAGAELFCPHGLAEAAAGNLPIFAWDSRAIRKADSSRVITTVSGTGEHRFGVGCGQSHAARCGVDQ